MAGEQAVQTRAVWGIAADASSRRVVLVGTLSLLLHVVMLSPLGALLGMWRLSAPEQDAPLLPPLTEIPISLLDEDGQDVAGPSPAVAPEPPAQAPQQPEASVALPMPQAPKAEPQSKPAPKKLEPATADAGAAPSVEPPAKQREPEPKPVAANAPPDAGAPGVAARDVRASDPTAMVGSAAKVTDSQANVRLLIYTARIRGHLLGQRIGALFTNLPQWQSFLGSTDLDLVRDVDAIFLAGPQFRRSDQVMALLDYNVPLERMRTAIDGLVKRDAKGRWLKADFPAAVATADRAQRLFVLPKASLAIVSPLSAEQAVLRQGPTLEFRKPKGDEAVVAYVKTPWRVLLGTGLSLPQSIAWTKLRLTPIDAGAVVIELTAMDHSAQEAKTNAAAISRMINDAAQLGGVGSLLAGFGFAPLLDRVELRAKGKEISGTLKVSAAQLRRILGYVEAWSESYSGRRRSPVKPPAAAPSRSTPSGGGLAQPSEAPPAAAPPAVSASPEQRAPAAAPIPSAAP